MVRKPEVLLAVWGVPWVVLLQARLLDRLFLGLVQQSVVLLVGC
ncbi:hypothetical protein [Aeromonas veronii]